MLSNLVTKANPGVRPLAVRSGASMRLCAIVARHPLFQQKGRSLVAFCTAHGSNAEVKIAIEGMMCGGCSSRIETVLKGMEAVKDVSVSLEGKVATVHLAQAAAGSKDAVAAVTALVDAINGMGFEAKLSQ